MKPCIAITTDFGDQFATAQLQAVVRSLGFDGHLIENHSVTPFSLIEGAFEIEVLSRFTPPGTVHLGVIDPGVGSQRRGIIIKSKNFYFVGPDNGIFSPAARRDGIEDVWKIKEDHINPHASVTFHGRDIFIKAAVYLAQGETPEQIGCTPIDPASIETLTFQPGQVLHIDDYGNVKIYWPHEIIPGKTIKVGTNRELKHFPIVRTFSDVRPGEPLALLGSSDTLELAINLGNAAKQYRISPENILTLQTT